MPFPPVVHRTLSRAVLLSLSLLSLRSSATAPAVDPLVRCERKLTSAADCARCHPAFADEWSRTAHARAFVDPIWRQELARTKEPERCIGCHAPQPVSMRLGRMPAARADERDRGVDCAACHEHRGVIRGPFGSAIDGHAHDGDPLYGEIGSVNLCASCHDTRIGPVLPLWRDYRESSHARSGHGCVRCHMQREERTIAVDPTTGEAVGQKREGRSHILLGPSDPDFAASAFEVDVRVDADRVLLTIQNLAGHRVPGLVGRSFAFEVEQRSATRSLSKSPVVISADNLLLVDETREFRFEKAAGATHALLRVVHGHNGVPTPILERRFGF